MSLDLEEGEVTEEKIIYDNVTILIGLRIN